MTYTELLTEIRRINCDPLAGSGKFTKEELLADRICAILESKNKPPKLIQVTPNVTPGVTLESTGEIVMAGRTSA